MQNLQKVPMLEPADSQEAKDYVKEDLRISEQFDTPVLIRVTTRICNSKTLVEIDERKEVGMKGYVKIVRNMWQLRQMEEGYMLS